MEDSPLFLLANGYCVPNEDELEVLKSSGIPWLNRGKEQRDMNRVVVHRTKNGLALDHPWGCDVPYMREVPFSDVMEVISKSQGK